MAGSLWFKAAAVVRGRRRMKPSRASKSSPVNNTPMMRRQRIGGVAIAKGDLDRALRSNARSHRYLPARASAVYEESLPFFRKEGSRLSVALSNLGAIANMRDDPATAVGFLSEATNLSRSDGMEAVDELRAAGAGLPIDELLASLS